MILAGVHAWGACPLEDVAPRPLLPVADRPLICHVLDWFARGAVSRATVCANSDTRALREALGTRRGDAVAIDYFEDRMPRGPAGCARDAAFSVGEPAETYVVADGTILPQIDLCELLDHHRRADASVTVVVSGTTAARNPHAGLLEPAGIYVFSAEALREVGTTGYQDIKERLIPRLYRSGRRIEPFAVGRDAAPRVTGAESYLALSHIAIERIAGQNPPPQGYRRVSDSLVHETAWLAPTASLIGPVIVGPGADIRDSSMLVGPSSVGEGCVVGRGAVISRSTLWRDCSIADGTIVDRCVVVDHTTLDGETSARDAVLMPSGSGVGTSDRERLRRRMRPSRRRGATQALKLDL